MRSRWRREIQADLQTLLETAHLRHLRALEGPQDAEIELAGQRVINFSSNNYLGLANDNLLTEAVQRGTSAWGVGGGGARLITGTAGPVRELEEELAEWKQTARALLFPSGYQANVGLIPALCGAGDLIFSDELNHASIIDGCRLSRAQVRIYRHLDLTHLEELLRAEQVRACRKLVISETVFSMDGDVLDVPRWSELARTFDALRILDDAHAIGVLGENGAGLALSADADVIVGTLGKAFGVSGAFVCTDTLLFDWLVNRCRSFIFSTAPSIPTCAAALAALRAIRSEEGERRRVRLRKNIDLFSAGLDALGLKLRRGHILPLHVRGGENTTALQLSARLLEAGLHVQAIRPPTIPRGTSRLRWTLMSTHTSAHIEQALKALEAQRDLLP